MDKTEDPMNEKKVQTSLQLTITQYKELKNIAYLQRRTMSEIAREVIAKYLAEAEDSNGEKEVLGRPE